MVVSSLYLEAFHLLQPPSPAMRTSLVIRIASTSGPNYIDVAAFAPLRGSLAALGPLYVDLVGFQPPYICIHVAASAHLHNDLAASGHLCDDLAGRKPLFN
jgi:hypothetical protein